MSDKKVNKVTYAGEVLVDLTEDTVTAGTLDDGVTAHDASGAQIVGTANPVQYETKNGTVTLKKSDNKKITNLKIYGVGYQNSTTGLNILIPNSVDASYNGLTVSKYYDEENTADPRNHTITIDGTATQGGSFKVGTITTKANTKYRLIGTPAGVTGCYLQLQDRTTGDVTPETGEGIIFNGKADWPFDVYICYDEGAVIENALFKPMISTSMATTYDKYEPYTWGEATPSLTHPQSIKRVVNPVIKVHGKNLCNLNSYKGMTNNGITYTPYFENDKLLRIHVEGTATADSYSNSYWVCQPEIGKTYCLSGCERLNDSGNARGYYSYVNGKEARTYDGPVLITDDSKIRYRINVKSGETVNRDVHPQIEEGNTQTVYAPYVSKEITIETTLNAIPVTSGGNVTIDGQNYISDYIDVERGKIRRELGSVDTSPCIRVGATNTSDKKRFVIGVGYKYANSNDDVVPAKCSALISVSPSNTYNTIEGCAITINGELVVYFGESSLMTTADEFNTWWDAQNIDLIAVLQTSVEEDLPEKTAAALKNLVTYYHDTTVTVSSSDQTPYATFGVRLGMLATKDEETSTFDPSSLETTYRKYQYGEHVIESNSLKASKTNWVRIATIRNLNTDLFENFDGTTFCSCGLEFLFKDLGRLYVSFKIKVSGSYFSLVDCGCTKLDKFNTSSYDFRKLNVIGIFKPLTGDVDLCLGLPTNSSYSNTYYIYDCKIVDCIYTPGIFTINPDLTSVEPTASSSVIFADVHPNYDFLGATASLDGLNGLVPAPTKNAVNGDFALLPSGEWGRLKALGYYQATANSTIDAPTNKVMSYVISSTVASSLSDSLPSTNNQVLLSMPAGDSNDYFQLSVDTAANDIFMRTRKKVDDTNTWTAWESLKGGSGGLSGTVLSATVPSTDWIRLGELPITMFTNLVVYNNEYHLIGKNGSSNNGHYKWNGSSWVSVGTTEHKASSFTCVVYNNKIYRVLGGYGGSAYSVFDGTSWTAKNDVVFPESSTYCQSVVFQDKIHLIGTEKINGSTDYDHMSHYHYTFDGSTTVTLIGELPYSPIYGFRAIVFDNKIHLLGGAGDPTAHYTFDGASWTLASTLPREFCFGSILVYHDELYMMGGCNTSQTEWYDEVYKWNGSLWELTTSISALNSGNLRSQTSYYVFNDKVVSFGVTDIVQLKYISDWYALSTPEAITKTVSDEAITADSFLVSKPLSPINVVCSDGTASLTFNTPDNNTDVKILVVNP